MIEKSIVERVEKLLIYQLRNWWGDFNEDVIINSIPAALVQMEQNYTAMPSGRFCNGGKMVFDPLFSVTWMIFLYRISRILYQGGIAMKLIVFII